MQRIAIPLLAFFIVLPAFANARLPVVNLASGGVSARAAFGEKPAKNNNQSRIVKRTVVARPAIKKTVAPAVSKAGENFANSDVLIPRRPSSNLWANGEVPLRIPRADEFSVIRSDNLLPEENIDEISRPAVVARSSNGAIKSSASNSSSEIDSQIARLNELQRRADESVESRSKLHENNNEIASAHNDTSSNNDVSLSRVAVPMGDEVIVRSVEKSKSPRIASVRDDMTKMTPSELRKAFRKTFLSENKHLSSYEVDNRFDEASDMSTGIEGFTAKRNLSESGGIRPLEIKITFRNDDSSLSRDNYNLLAEYAGIVLNNPTRAVQISIPEAAIRGNDSKKLAAKRLAIVEQVLRDSGISEQRIMPVLSQRGENGFVLRMISLAQYETMTQKRRDVFGDTVGKRTYKSMSW